MALMWNGLLPEYRDRLPLETQDVPVTLFEGNTPLVRATALEELVAQAGQSAGVDSSGTEIYLKYDGANPTG